MDKDFKNQLYRVVAETVVENRQMKQELKEMDDKIFEWMSKCFELEKQLEALKKGGGEQDGQ